MSFLSTSLPAAPVALMAPCSTVVASSAKNKDAPQIFAFGGYLPSGEDNSSLLQFDTATDTWKEHKTTGKSVWPQGKAHSAMVFRKNANSLVVFGGLDSSELWEYSLSKGTWTLLASTPNETRANHTAIYLEKMDMLVVYGGTVNTNDLTQGFISVYNFEEKKWKKFKPKERPEFERLDHSSVLWKDEFMIMFGGIDGEDRALNDVWKLYCTPHKWSQIGLNMKWEKLECKGDVPPARSRHAASIFEDKMYIYGGVSADGECFNDLYCLDLDTLVWERLDIISPTLGRNGHAMHAVLMKEDEESGEDSEDEDVEAPTIPDFIVMFGNDKEFKVLNEVEFISEASLEDLMSKNSEKAPEKSTYDFSIQVEFGMLKRKLECKGMKGMEYLLLTIIDELGLSAHSCKLEWKSNGKWMDLKTSSISALPSSFVLKVEE